MRAERIQMWHEHFSFLHLLGADKMILGEKIRKSNFFVMLPEKKAPAVKFDHWEKVKKIILLRLEN